MICSLLRGFRLLFDYSCRSLEPRSNTDIKHNSEHPNTQKEKTSISQKYTHIHAHTHTHTEKMRERKRERKTSKERSLLPYLISYSDGVDEFVEQHGVDLDLHIVPGDDGLQGKVHNALPKVHTLHLCLHHTTLRLALLHKCLKRVSKEQRKPKARQGETERA